MSTASSPVIYQLVVRYFGNVNPTRRACGTIDQNGCGHFADINDTALRGIADLGVTHIWLTGVLRQATLTAYPDLGLTADAPDVVKGRAGSFYAIRDYFDVCPDYAVNPADRLGEFDALVARIHKAGLKVLIDFVPNHVARGYRSIVRPELNFGDGDDASRFFDPNNHFYYVRPEPPDAVRETGHETGLETGLETGQASGQELAPGLEHGDRDDGAPRTSAEAAGHDAQADTAPREQVEPLFLSRPEHWNPAGVAFEGFYDPEDGTPGRPVKVTGNNAVSSTPAAYDWYETIKLNYGYNFVTRTGHYEPRPRLWDVMDEILAYWQGRGVDGFRCDFAHYVPPEAWTYLIGRSRRRDPQAYFVAEAYPYADSGDPITHMGQLIDVGFDAVYHDDSYNRLKRIYQFAGSIEDYDYSLVRIAGEHRQHYLHYLENHDERRIASPAVPGVWTGDSGFGQMEAAYLLAPLQLLAGPGPVLVLNGQEVGEPGADAEGFSGRDGRTTLFDYWSMPAFVKWVHDHAYDGGGLSDDQAALRVFYRNLLRLRQHPSVLGSGFWGLRYFNHPHRHADCPDTVHTFARFAPGSGCLILVAGNFDRERTARAVLRIPPELALAAGLSGRCGVRVVLSADGQAHTAAGEDHAGATPASESAVVTPADGEAAGGATPAREAAALPAGTPEQLATTGIATPMRPQTAVVFEVRSDNGPRDTPNN